MGGFDAGIAVAVVIVTETETDFPRKKRVKWSIFGFCSVQNLDTELICKLSHNEP